MKLVELLARELSDWPEKASHAVQHENGDVGFTYDGKPGRDEDHSDWSINALTASEKAYWLIGVAKSISTIASDHATAIVTRFDWSAERARIAKPAKNAEGWIRHRGGKCPVAAGTEVSTRHRDGKIEEVHHMTAFEGASAESLKCFWSHENDDSDIMAYKMHKPAEHVEPFIEAVQAFHALEKFPQLDGPLQWRDRIAEIDVEVQARTVERAELVQKLASEGFALIGRVVDPVEDMSDWRNWRVGDFVTIEGNSSGHKFKTGGITRIKSLSDEDGCGFSIEHIDSSDYWYVDYPDLSWHSRPSA